MARRKAYDKHEIRAGLRNLVKISGSHYLSIPPEFIEAHGLKAGDTLPIAYNGVLMITPIPKVEDALIPKEEILLPYPNPKNIDTDDENRLAVAAYNENYERIHDYVKQEQPTWKMVGLSMETVNRAGQKFFRVIKIINTTPVEEK